MTDPTKLADALVDAGIGYAAPANVYGIPPDGSGERKTAEGFITDWRVAGKVLESMGGIYAHCEPHVKGWHCYLETDKAVRLPVDNATAQHESLPRAVIEAWYGARQSQRAQALDKGRDLPKCGICGEYDHVEAAHDSA